MSRARDNADATSQTYIENATAAQELSGTYATNTERLYFNDLYTLTGNVTIQENAHLALGTIADKDVVITQDGTERTITGEGTLESGELMVSEKTDLTGMTGVLGSAVTGGAGLSGMTSLGTVTTGTLGSGVVFPAGHMEYITSVTGDGSGTFATFPHDGSNFTGSYSYFKIIGNGVRSSTNDSHLYFQLADSTGFWSSSNYTRAGYATTHDSGSTVGPNNSTATTNVFFHNGASSNAAYTVSLELDIYNAQSTTECKIVYIKAGGGRQNNANSLHGSSTWAYWNNSSTALTGLKFYGSAGNIYGTFKLYGIR